MVMRTGRSNDHEEVFNTVSMKDGFVSALKIRRNHGWMEQ